MLMWMEIGAKMAGNLEILYIYIYKIIDDILNRFQSKNGNDDLQPATTVSDCHGDSSSRGLDAPASDASEAMASCKDAESFSSVRASSFVSLMGDDRLRNFEIKPKAIATRSTLKLKMLSYTYLIIFIYIYI